MTANVEIKQTKAIVLIIFPLFTALDLKFSLHFTTAAFAFSLIFSLISKFSLFKDSLIIINQTGKDSDTKFYYYKGTDIDGGRINVINIDSSDRDTKIRISPKGLHIFKKYQVDIL